MFLAKTIEEIYDEARAKEADLVLTNDVALATAINALNDEPMVGVFAMTPMQVASKHAIEILAEPLWSEMRTIQTISDETGLDFRYVHGEVNRIREISRYTDDIEQFLTPSSKRVLESWADLPTLESVMEEFDADHARFYEGKRITTIGFDFFDRLDAKMVPKGQHIHDISLFKEGEYNIPRVYGIGNDRQIADNAVKLIDPLNPLDYAIVLDADSSLADAVRSALYREGLPFVNRLEVRDLNVVRDFLQMADMCMSYRTLRVRDIRDAFASLRAMVPAKADEHLLHKERFTDLAAEALRLLMEEASLYGEQGRGVTFSELAERIFAISGRHSRRGLSSIMTIIDDLGLSSEFVTPPSISKMEYAVDNVRDIPCYESIPEDEKRGVLLADCKSSVYIDRPIVIYAGMGQDWNVDLVKKPFISDIESESDKVAATMSVMLQQGSVRFYLVNRTKEGRAAVPSSMFNEMIKAESKAIERFSELTDDYNEERWYDPERSGYRPEAIDAEENYTASFSQSSFKEYVRCPRAFMYNLLLPSSDKAIMGFGTMIHEFAELYASYREEVLDAGIESFIEKSCERNSGLSTPLLEEMDRDRIRFAMVNIKEFIDSLGLGAPEEGEWKEADSVCPNWFYRNCFDEPKTRTYMGCESDEESKIHRIHGKLDLRHGKVIVDYKTGSAKSGVVVADAFKLDLHDGKADFQCLFYLAIASELYGSDTFELFFVMDDDPEPGDSNSDRRFSICTVKLIEQDLEWLKRDPAVIEAFERDTNSRAKFKGQSEQFISILLENSVEDMSDWSNPEANHVAFRAMGDAFYDGKNMSKETFTKNVERYLNTIGSPVIAGNRTVYVKRGYLEDFLIEVDGLHAQMVEGSNKSGGLMPHEDTDCRGCRYFQVCTVDRNDEEGVQ